MPDRRADQELVSRAQQGDTRAFELLVLKYQQKIAGLISRYIRDPSEVMDVSQEAFLKAYRALPGFRGESAFFTWLYRIAINTVKNYLVAQWKHQDTHFFGQAKWVSHRFPVGNCGSTFVPSALRFWPLTRAG